MTMKTIEVNISQCLSSTQEIQVPDDFEYDQNLLLYYVREQIILPSEIIFEHSDQVWYVDDTCVI